MGAVIEGGKEGADEDDEETGGTILDKQKEERDSRDARNRWKDVGQSQGKEKQDRVICKYIGIH